MQVAAQAATRGPLRCPAVPCPGRICLIFVPFPFCGGRIAIVRTSRRQATWGWLVHFFVLAGAKRLPKLLMACCDEQVFAPALILNDEHLGATRPVVGLYTFLCQRNIPLPRTELRSKWAGFGGNPHCTPLYKGEYSVGGPGGSFPRRGGAW